MLLVVNYHYISEDSFPYDGIHPITPRDFRAQLLELGRSFDFISMLDLFHALAQTELPNRACLITFDDGLREQFEIGWSILQELRVPAVFFTNIAPTLTRRVDTVHKLHWLRANTEPSVLQMHLQTVMQANGVKIDWEALTPERLATQYQYDSHDVRRLKYALNIGLSRPLRERIIDSLFKELIGNEPALADRLYMKPSHWSELAAHESLGTHGYNHLPLATLSPKVIIQEIVQSVAILQSETGKTISAISYPYGGVDAVSLSVAEIAKKAGLQVGFTMERVCNQTLLEPLLLSRFDTNDVPGGKSPNFLVEGKELLWATAPRASRKLWIQELPEK